MTQEDKDLLLKDLCTRLSYEVKVKVNSEYLSEGLIKADYNKPLVVYGITADGSVSFTLDKGLMEYSMPILSIKPYLFPLSSMTEEQYNSLHESGILDNCSHSYEYVNPHIYGISFIFKKFKTYSLELIEWLNKNHFDYRGLIEKGLAIDATGLNIY